MCIRPIRLPFIIIDWPSCAGDSKTNLAYTLVNCHYHLSERLFNVTWSVRLFLFLLQNNVTRYKLYLLHRTERPTMFSCPILIFLNRRIKGPLNQCTHRPRGVFKTIVVVAKAQKEKHDHVMQYHVNTS